MLTAAQVREILKLRPLPTEGGYFAETYRSELTLPAAALPASFGAREGEGRNLATAIFYLLTPETISAMHRLRADELYHFYLGDPVELLELRPDGTAEVVTLGQEIAAGMRLQHLVRSAVWQGSRLAAVGAWALLGTTMSPGFEFADFELGQREVLKARYQLHAALIEQLTR
ncbi:MAG TPA: cupin domain-containing protein [Candidatus Acidoferrales bacterium]|nr:cupin domain-containing protein [Candidatus Acidoferrales bacterium]